MRVCVGADHAGFLLKEAVRKFLFEIGHEVEDLGTHTTDPVDYPDYAEAVVNSILGGHNERGVLICGSGVGASVAANKIQERAPVCVTTRTPLTRAWSTTT